MRRCSLPWHRPLSAVSLGAALLIISQSAHSQEPKEKAAPPGERGSIVEDRAARKQLEAGDARLESGEAAKAIEVWQSVIERYPRSRVRFEAHLRLGNHLLNKERQYDRARTHFEAVAIEENPDEAKRAEGTLKIGVCYFEGRNYGKCFKYMRDVIEQFPVSPQVNEAYYYIGLAHFQQGHYSRAITALERVGTALPAPEPGSEKVQHQEVLEAGKRLFIRIEDADLAALETGKTVPIRCETASGDAETVNCIPIGRNVRLVVGSIPTALGLPNPGNGTLDIRGGDRIKLTYQDIHTSEGAKEKPVTREIPVVGTGIAAIMDGAFAETLQGVVLGRGINIQVTDADFDITDGADVLKAKIEVYREKTTEELTAEGNQPGVDLLQPAKNDANKLDRFKKIDGTDVILTEAKIARTEPGKEQSPTEEADTGKNPEKPAPPEPAGQKPNPVNETAIHSGVFRAVVPLEATEEVKTGDPVLQALPNDLIVLTYEDAKNATGEPITVTFKARCVEGSLGSVRVSQTQISDQELRVKTRLKTASALTNIGNRYKEFGLKQHADDKYKQALVLCEEITNEARKLGGRTLEETYVQLWKIYFEMDNLALAAAMSQRLQREFPNSEFVDAALISLADVARKQGDHRRAIGIYTSVLRLQKSPLRGEAQFGIAESYEDMAKAAEGPTSAQLYDQAFQEYKKVFDLFPDSGRVGEAVAKMANYYYVQKDYARAIDVFENVLRTHQDAKFLDVILFNYGRCLYRLEKKAEARQQFDQLIADFPESALAGDAKKISEALRKGGF